MILDFTQARYCSGYGDLCLWRWFPQVEIIHPDEQKRHFFQMMGGIAHSPGSIQPDVRGKKIESCYQTELKEKGTQSRLLLWAGILGLSEVKRPEISVSHKAADWGQENASDVLLFPECNYPCRTYPAALWVDLAWQMTEQGMDCAIVTQKKNPQFQNVPQSHYSFSWESIVSLIANAGMVIGNDSAPAHVAGTLDVPTIALLGPTKSTVFDHLESVKSFTSKMDCTGCHFSGEYRPACQVGCRSLMAIQPEELCGG